MGGDLDEVALNRLRRVGIIPLTTEKGLELFDAARQIDEAAIVPVHLDLTALRRFAKAGVLPPLLRRLVRAPLHAGRSRERSLARRLAAIPKAEWNDIVLQTLRSEVAAVLGYDSAEMIDPQVEFKDLGFDSLAAVELYNRLCQTTALRLPTTMGFDYPTPEALAGFLQEQMEGGGEDGKAKADSNGKAKAAEAGKAKATAKTGTAKKAKAKTGTAKKAKAKAGSAKKAKAKTKPKAKAKANGKAKTAAAKKAKAEAKATLARKAKAVGAPEAPAPEKAKQVKG